MSCRTKPYCSLETDLPLVAAACVYVAAKAEETAIHIKVVVTEARATFSGELAPISPLFFFFPSDGPQSSRVWHCQLSHRFDQVGRNGVL